MTIEPPPPSAPDRPSVAPATPKRKPRYVLGTFWLIVGILALLSAIASHNWWVVLVGIAAIAYSIYLYRGGRYGVWFI